MPDPNGVNFRVAWDDFIGGLLVAEAMADLEGESAAVAAVRYDDILVHQVAKSNTTTRSRRGTTISRTRACSGCGK